MAAPSDRDAPSPPSPPPDAQPLPEPRSRTRIAIDLVFGLAAVAFSFLAGLYAFIFVLLTPLAVMKAAIAVTWIAGFLLVLWVWLSRGWPAIAVAFGLIVVLLALASAAETVKPISFGY